jgi:molybdopterin-containing oxidoreductase family iron-sulfur binding subunit
MSAKDENSDRLWRSLGELEDTPEFREALHREFPLDPSVWADEVSRRRFLQVMGASIALAGLSSCTPGMMENVVPFVRAPEGVVPGKPDFYATGFVLQGYATGILVESYSGRATKVEGNPDHPSSGGACDRYGQAHVLSLYDPDRSRNVLHEGRIATWDEFDLSLSRRAEKWGGRGERLRILSGEFTSPSLEAQRARFLSRFPGARWHGHEPVSRKPVWAGADLAFGRRLEPVYRISRAKVIVSLDADFLYEGPGRIRYASEFMEGRRVREGRSEMNRLHVVETVPTITGAMADHRQALRPSEIAPTARALAHALGVEGGVPAPEPARGWVSRAARDLLANRGRCLVIAGERQPAEMHALAHAINERLGAIGKTVQLIPALVPELDSIEDLAAEMRAGKVDTLILLGTNPVYDAPADLEFGDALGHVPFSIQLSGHVDETARLCSWHLPESHALETWGDALGHDGTATLLQPLVERFFGTRDRHELLAQLLGDPIASSREVVRSHWRSQVAGQFEIFWRKSLREGRIKASAPAPVTAHLRRGAGLTQSPASGNAPAQGLELAFFPDPTIHDGRFGNNGWLQELGKPITRLTWDNALLLSRKTAQTLGVANGQMLAIRHEGRALEAAAWILPGHPDGVASLSLGYGRNAAGRVGNGMGFNAYALRTSRSPWSLSGVEATRLQKTYSFATVQEHWAMEGRDLVREASIQDFRKDLKKIIKIEEPPVTLYPEYPHDGPYQWGMTIDLNACIGCAACVVACYAENNIPVVGKDQVRRGREMAWLRVDRYFKGPPDSPKTLFQPVPCMHCEKAPCELVCPVEATIHSSEGLNQMVYNRCIGTRYCSNNCPYKVRRFNFLEYTPRKKDLGAYQKNPDVTVRTRGVMEKCTYCIQRIEEGRIQAQEENRLIRDLEVRTACQQTCPTDAIVFGNIHDPTSQVSRLKREPQNYELLGELGTRPRTTYLSRFSNEGSAT